MFSVDEIQQPHTKQLLVDLANECYSAVKSDRRLNLMSSEKIQKSVFNFDKQSNERVRKCSDRCLITVSKKVDQNLRKDDKLIKKT